MLKSAVASTIFCAALVIGAVAPVHASGHQATSTPFTLVSHEVFQGALPECFAADLLGTNVATETTTGKIVETSSGVFHVSGRNVYDYRVDFPNGMYAFGTGTSHFSFMASPGATVFTHAGHEPRTVYDASGRPVASVVLHAVSHTTFHDANRDGQPQPEELSSSLDRFFFTCHRP